MRTICLSAALILTGSFTSVAQLSPNAMNRKTGHILRANDAISCAEKIAPQSNHVAALNDVGMVDTFPGPYTMIPVAQLQTINISARVVNSGSNTETNVGYNVTVYFIQSGFSTAIYASPNATVPVLNAGDTSANLSAGSFTPADTGIYIFEYITVMDSIDLDTSNDTLYGYLVVNDSAYARDYAVVNSLFNFSLGFSPTGTGTLGQNYDVYTATAVTSVTFYLSSGVIGDQTSVTILAVNGLGIPSTPLGTTPVYTMTAADTGGVFLTLSFTTPIAVSPGSFFAGVNQLTAGHNISLAQCNDIYTPGTAFYRTGGNWFRIDSTAFHGSFILRPNTSTTALEVKEYSSTNGFDMYPNPSTGMIHIRSESKTDEDFYLTVFNVLGEVVYRYEIKSFSSEHVVDLSALSPNLYSVRLVAKTNSFNKLVLITN